MPSPSSAMITSGLAAARRLKIPLAVDTVTPGWVASMRMRLVRGSKPRIPSVVTTRETPPKSSPARAREPSPASHAGLVMKSTRGTKRRFSCAVTMITSRHSEAMSLAPPVPGSRTLGRAYSPMTVVLMLPY